MGNIRQNVNYEKLDIIVLVCKFTFKNNLRLETTLSINSYYEIFIIIFNNFVNLVFFREHLILFIIPRQQQTMPAHQKHVRKYSNRSSHLHVLRFYGTERRDHTFTRNGVGRGYLVAVTESMWHILEGDNVNVHSVTAACIPQLPFNTRN